MTAVERPGAELLRQIGGEQADALGKQRVAVFGGTGLVGTAVIAALAEAGAKTICVARKAPHRRVEGVSYVEASVLDEASAIPFDSAIYIAGATSDYLSDPLATVRCSTEGLLRVLDRAQGRRVVYVSSGRVYGRRPEPRPLVESESMLLGSPAADNVYDAAKLLGEALCARAAAKGVGAVVVRPGNIYGPWGERRPVTGLTQMIAEAMAQGRIRLRGAPAALRNHVFVADVADGILRALTGGRAGEAYNLGSADHLTNAQLAERISASLPSRVPVEADSQIAGGHMVLSSEKAQNELGYRSRGSVERDLSATIQWILHQ